MGAGLGYWALRHFNIQEAECNSAANPELFFSMPLSEEPSIKSREGSRGRGGGGKGR